MGIQLGRPVTSSFSASSQQSNYCMLPRAFKVHSYEARDRSLQQSVTCGNLTMTYCKRSKSKRTQLARLQNNKNKQSSSELELRETPGGEEAILSSIVWKHYPISLTLPNALKIGYQQYTSELKQMLTSQLFIKVLKLAYTKICLSNKKTREAWHCHCQPPIFTFLSGSSLYDFQECYHMLLLLEICPSSLSLPTWQRGSKSCASFRCD